jgi:hypothetical protein
MIPMLENISQEKRTYQSKEGWHGKGEKRFLPGDQRKQKICRCIE